MARNRILSRKFRHFGGGSSMQIPGPSSQFRKPSREDPGKSLTSSSLDLFWRKKTRQKTSLLKPWNMLMGWSFKPTETWIWMHFSCIHRHVSGYLALHSISLNDRDFPISHQMTQFLKSEGLGVFLRLHPLTKETSFTRILVVYDQLKLTILHQNFM